MFMLAKADQIFCFDKYFVRTIAMLKLYLCVKHKLEQINSVNLTLTLLHPWRQIRQTKDSNNDAARIIIKKENH